MADLTIPAGPEALTPEWLTQALRETGTITKSAVTSFDAVPIGEGVGFMGQLAKVQLQYDAPEEGAPQTLIAKFPAVSNDNREVANIFRFYERETKFYEEIASTVQLQTPDCYFNSFNKETGAFVLLLEDLTNFRVGDQVAGCSAEDADLALRALAKFHAAWWESPRLAELDWMPLTNDTVIAQTAQQAYNDAWGPVLEAFGALIPPVMRELGERFGKHVVDLMNELAVPPRTISHGDYRLDNLFFPTDGSEKLTVIDWQISSRGRGVFDVAYFLSGTLQPEERKAKEMELLKTYHQVLTENGVQGYDFDQCFQDYRASTLFSFLYSVIAIGSLDLANERGQALFTNNLTRNIAAISDLNAGELLPD